MEKVHTFIFKKLLNVSPRTPSDMTSGETGRFPLYVHSYTVCIKYWLCLTRMDISRLPQKAYSMLLLVHDTEKFCWASQVHQVFYKFGFGCVQNPQIFIKAFKQRLTGCHSQNWHEHISNSTRFTIYRMFKISISLEPYFTSVTSKHIRDVLIRFRIEASNMRTHKDNKRDIYLEKR